VPMNVLTALGDEGERLLVSLLVTDKEAATLLLPDADPAFFSGKASQFLIETAQAFYAARAEVVPFTFIRAVLVDAAELGNLPQGFLVEVESVYHTLRERMQDPSEQALRGAVLDAAPDWLRQRALLKTVRSVAEGLSAGKPLDDIANQFSRALAVGTTTNSGPKYLFGDADAFIAALKWVDEDGQRIGTGVIPLDEGIGGGIVQYEIATVLGGTGKGKSHTLCWIGMQTLLQGKRVLHITLEMPALDVWCRYAAALTGIDSYSIRHDPELAREALAQIGLDLSGADLRVEQFAMRTLTVTRLRGLIDRMAIVDGFVPDVILIDYVDLMKSTSKDGKEYQDQAELYMDVRGTIATIAPVYTVAQTNRGGQEKNKLDLADTGNSFDKLRHCDVIIGYEAPENDRIGPIQYGRLRPLKVRGAVQGESVSFSLDMRLSRFSLETRPADLEVDEDEDLNQATTFVSPLEGRKR